MSLFNSMQTAVSGMSAQTTSLSTIGDNIANSGTVGYKAAGVQFATLLGNAGATDYTSGGVQTDIRYGITSAGPLESTTSSTDLAIGGTNPNGFFVVSQNGQGSYLTRAGSFVPDTNGNLVNAAGYQLMGYAVNTNGTASSTLSVVNVNNSTLQAAASTNGTLAVNLPSTDTAMTTAANLPSKNPTSGAAYSEKSSMTVYDNLGQADVLDVYMTKTGPNAWEVTAYQQSAAASGGGFPYSSGPLGTVDLTFSATGAVASSTNPLTGNATTPTGTLNLAVPNGNTVAVDLSQTTQLAAGFSNNVNTANGNAPSKLASVQIGTDGTLTEVYASGFQKAAYKIPLANVQSPDNLTPLNGNVYQVSQTSGNMLLGTPGTNGLGTIQSDQLEQSNVDLASELSNMIVAQRAYEANSKVLQTASDLLGTLDRITVN